MLKRLHDPVKNNVSDPVWETLLDLLHDLQLRNGGVDSNLRLKVLALHLFSSALKITEKRVFRGQNIHIYCVKKIERKTRKVKEKNLYSSRALYENKQIN